ncbi:MAG TPA: carbamoyltransferase HypF [Candidatus Sulfotelmatobacter sp.]|nr:carbamoyltransferase HypF [Candidatus Sulfotelmatobacter sp.]
MRVKVNVTGIVQGVGFRPFIYRTATKHSLAGYVRNLGDAGVEILLEGTEQAINAFLHDLREKKPPLAQINSVITSSVQGNNKYQEFKIANSSDQVELAGSIVPPDVAICNDCLHELRDPKDPRYDYFFITCVNCGPRFTIIEKLPYDRENTTMREFPLCGFCLKEYQDSLNRRFHAQTVACPQCGPRAYLTASKGKDIAVKDPVREAGHLLSEGYVLAVKGYGGFHIAASTILEKPLLKLRQTKHRKTKPFAIMAKDLEATKSFAEINSKEQDLLTSHIRPIVLLNKRDSYSLSPLIAPGLHNVGVMLPYSGLHYMLFDDVHDMAFVMTSANPANEPIVKDNDTALKMLGDTVDYFLFHDRKIAQRCDDSVARIHDNRVAFIRRSRGYAPAPIMLKEKAKRCILALGGELNGTVCILQDNKAFVSQHIGDIENLETRNFLEEVANHLIELTNTDVNTIACDLHPKFTTTNLAEELAKQTKWKLIKVQHHHAHVAGLMMEHGLDELIGVACDGYGYGLNGEVWGGEILYCRRDSLAFDRLGHLEPQPLLGGDVATRYPLRVAAGILSKKLDIANWLRVNSQHLPYGKSEVEIMLQQLDKKSNIPETTSCGRILDAIAAILGICYERTYEGEPAIKLESIAMKGRDILQLKPIINGNRLDTTELLLQIFENCHKISNADLAYSAHAYLAAGLVMLAVDAALEKGVKSIGFTGGAACNEILVRLMRYQVESADLQFFAHETLPAGDGGISFGQAVVGGFSDF